MVAGSGSQGLIIVAKPEIKTFQDLKGKKIGTFQADTLDIPVYDYSKKLASPDIEPVLRESNAVILCCTLSGRNQLPGEGLTQEQVPSRVASTWA